jgi:hypothetical protein
MEVMMEKKKSCTNRAFDNAAKKNTYGLIDGVERELTDILNALEALCGTVILVSLLASLALPRPEGLWCLFGVFFGVYGMVLCEKAKLKLSAATSALMDRHLKMARASGDPKFGEP